jgi:hypothetical protein
MRRVLTLSFIVAAIALLSIGAGGAVAAAGPVTAASGDAPLSATAAECDTGDGTDLVGCWNGTHYEEELSFNQTDGLTESQLEELTHLTMARVEHVRERPFREGVPVETVTRSEFMNGSAGGGAGGSGAEFQRWNDQVWKALFVVGEDENASDAIDGVFGGAVTGFYSPGQDRIVLVVPEGEDPQIDPSTLAHELVHAMQDQYHDLTRPRYVGATQDADLAVDGVVEGEAVHVEELYDARCAANWSCLAPPDSGGGGGGGGTTPDYNFGILQTVLQPYADGAFYVETLVDEGGWSAVNETMNRPPNATSGMSSERTTRERIADALRAEPATASELSADLGIPTSSVYSHLQHVATGLADDAGTTLPSAQPVHGRLEQVAHRSDPVIHPGDSRLLRSHSALRAGLSRRW